MLGWLLEWMEKWMVGWLDGWMVRAWLDGKSLLARPRSSRLQTKYGLLSLNNNNLIFNKRNERVIIFD